MAYLQINEKDLDRLEKDRLHFGFDSIYFRYSEAVDEAAMWKAKANRTLLEDELKSAKIKKMHFYSTLEQLMRIHEVSADGTNH